MEAKKPTGDDFKKDFSDPWAFNPFTEGPNSYNQPPIHDPHFQYMASVPDPRNTYPSYSSPQGNPFSANYAPLPTFPPSPLPPPPPPPAPAPVAPTTNSADDANTISRMEALLEAKLSQKDSRESDDAFERLEKLVSEQLAEDKASMQEIEDERKAQALSENEDRFARLELLLLEQRDEQLQRHVESESAWRAEKARSDAQAAKQAEEAKELANKEIAAAKAAKKAAEKALKFAKDQVEKRAREEAEAKAAEEQRKIHDDYRKRIEMYNDQTAEFGRKWQAMYDSEDRSSTPVPVRRTCISEGDRRIEVSEFSGGSLDPLATSQAASASFFQEDLFHLGSTQSRHRSVPKSERNDHRSLNNIRDTARSPKALEASTGADRSTSQQMILLPSMLDRTSRRTCEMQNSLDKCGVLATFNAQEYEAVSPLGLSAASGDELIRSTIFWEPSLLALGNEGQTYFQGHQPIHVHFFRPEYRPQFTASPAFSASECIIVAKDLIHEYELQELGFPVRSEDASAYALDSRLTANYIEALIDRSFMMRETSFRREHR
ncbi:hypothetical protein BDV95DRAFT_610420 [Massariosphaeria phaeospora]|uniref:Uncharacterized protein n=1 Tax=Massariosphaeria phaeospora TaxID=100035 RepID=A0A7C8M4F4_9PLEO|nr:hypothetical protein BDV95DRAFT_610420 [Massariosphaeria phaeospora]